VKKIGYVEREGVEIKKGGETKMKTVWKGKGEQDHRWYHGKGRQKGEIFYIY